MKRKRKKRKKKIKKIKIYDLFSRLEVEGSTAAFDEINKKRGEEEGDRKAEKA